MLNRLAILLIFLSSSSRYLFVAAPRASPRASGEVKDLSESDIRCLAPTYEPAAKVNRNDDVIIIWFGDAELEVWNRSTCKRLQTVPVNCAGTCTSWEGHGYANEILVGWTKTHVCRFNVFAEPLRVQNAVCDPAPFTHPVQLAFTDSFGFVLSMGDSYDGGAGGISYFPRSSSSTLSELPGSEFKQTDLVTYINPSMVIHKSQMIVIYDNGRLYFTINLTEMSRMIDRPVMDLGCSDSKRGGNGYVTSIISSTRRNVVFLSCASNHRVIEASLNDEGKLEKMRLLPNHGGDLQIFTLSNGNEYLSIIHNVHDEPRFRFTVFYVTVDSVRKVVKFTSDVWIRSSANPVTIDGKIAWALIGMDGQVYIAAKKLKEVKGVVADTDDVYDLPGDDFFVYSNGALCLIDAKTRNYKLLTTSSASFPRVQKISNRGFDELDPGESEGPSESIIRASRDTSRVLVTSAPTQLSPITRSPHRRMTVFVKSRQPADRCDGNQDPEYKRLFNETFCHLVMCSAGMKYDEVVGIAYGTIGEVLASVDVYPALTLNVSIDHSFQDDHVKIAIGDVQLTDAWKCESITSEKASEKMSGSPPTISAKPAITETLSSRAVALRLDSALLCFVALLRWQPRE